MRGSVSEPGSSVVKLRRKGAAAQQQALAPVYEPTPHEAPHIERRVARKAKRVPVPCLKVEMADGIARLSVDHPDQGTGWALLMEALCIDNLQILHNYLAGVSNCCSPLDSTAVNEDHLNSMVQTIAAMGPRDMAEAMLLVQMVAIHKTTMEFAGNVRRQKTVQLTEVYERSLNRLTRTYAAQMTTLKQYRSDGKQKIVVKHVTVNEGGQAIVGDVTHGGGGGGASEEGEATA